MLKSVVIGAGTMGLGICYLLSKNNGYVTVIVRDLAKEADKRAFLEHLAKKDEKIVLIVGDIGYGVFDDFRNQPTTFDSLVDHIDKEINVRQH